MKTFSVEIIKDRDNRGAFKDFKGYAAAKRYAVAESLKPGVLETFIDGRSDEDMDFEVMEYYSTGKLTNKIA